jgi:hypothetical protein
MSDQVRNIIRKTVLEMLNESISKENINHIMEKHIGKVHFIPIRYRILGGILQGLNIKFGNFIELLIGNLVDIDTNINVMPYSGKRIRLFFTPETDALIDSYITHRQLPNSPDDCTDIFDKLLNHIIEIESKAKEEDRQGIVKDIDGLFQTNDHDTGKFADINRKFIKTWAGLSVHLKIKKPDQLFPIIYYFNSTKRYGPIHTPSRNIMRGSQLFDAFLQTDYNEVDQYLSEIGDDPEILKIFDDLYSTVRDMKINGRQAKLI